MEGNGWEKGAAFLCSADNDMNAAVIESMLVSFGVPVFKKRTGSGDLSALFMGTSFFPVELFVPAGLLEKAREIMAAEPMFDEEEWEI